MLNYEITGNGPENLILLHGFMENLLIWEDLEPHLSKKFRLIKVDLPGHGRSEIYGEVHTMEFIAEKVKEVADKLQLEKFHLLGHSMGGYAALAFAEKFGENLKSLTLFFSTYFPDDEEKRKTVGKVSELFWKISKRMLVREFPIYSVRTKKMFLKEK